jgi:uncharacterized OsmC-like protein
MYAPEPERVVAEMHRVLRPGGRAVSAVWGERGKCGWADIFPIVDARVQSEVCPMFFRMGTGDCLARAYASAGFVDIRSHRFSSTLDYASADEACEAAFVGGPVALAYSRFTEAMRAGAHADYLASLEAYRHDGGYAVPGEFVVVAGTKQGGRSMSNLAARESLERARRLFLEKPAVARKSNTAATAVWRDGLSCEVSGPAGERAITDMPQPMGGNGQGPNPGWLLRASIASCAATAIAMRSTMMGVALKTLEVRVESESDVRGLVGIPDVSTALGSLRMSVRIGADGVDDARLRELAAWGEANSPVGCTLRDRPRVALEIDVV